MICRFKHNELCCNSGSIYYGYECKNCECMIPISNAERIRSMTDEELAEYLWVETGKTFNYCDVCKHYRLTAPHCAVRSQGSECIKARVDWLKQPYGGDT